MFKKIIFLTKPIRYWVDKITYTNYNDLRRLKALKDLYKGKPIIIVGNGPSLNKTPLDDFKQIPSIGMNKIDLLFPKVKWRPSLIICMNNLVIKQHWKTFINNKIPTYISWKGRWFIKWNKRKSLEYFLSKSDPGFSCDISNGLGSAGTVTYTALQFAYYMGGNPIILFGVDHSFDFEGSPANLAKRTGEDTNHFDPHYFKSGQWWGLPNLELSELGYSNAKHAFELDNRIVYDATVGGKLTVFDKITLDEARSLCETSN